MDTSSIMKCNVLDSMKKYVIMDAYAKTISSLIPGRTRKYYRDALEGGNN